MKTLCVEVVAKTSRSTVQHLTTRTHRFMNFETQEKADLKRGLNDLVDLRVQAMERMLRSHLRVKQLLTRVDEISGSITLHGNYREPVIVWLKSLGF